MDEEPHMESTAASVPEELWCTALLARGCVHQPEAPDLIFEGF